MIDWQTNHEQLADTLSELTQIISDWVCEHDEELLQYKNIGEEFEVKMTNITHPKVSGKEDMLLPEVVYTIRFNE